MIGNDGDPCTSDGCDPDLGCTIAPASGIRVTTETSALSRIFTIGGNVRRDRSKTAAINCTDSTCNPADGSCQSVPNTKGCDDGDPCTSGDTCAEERHGLVLESDPASATGWMRTAW